MSEAACKLLQPVPWSWGAGCSCCVYDDLLPKQHFAEVVVWVADNPAGWVAPFSHHLLWTRGLAGLPLPCHFPPSSHGWPSLPGSQVVLEALVLCFAHESWHHWFSSHGGPRSSITSDCVELMAEVKGAPSTGGFSRWFCCG